MALGVEMAKPFVAATIYVLSTMAGVTPKAGTPYVKKDSLAKGEVSAIVRVTGAAQGTIALICSNSCAVAMAKRMLGNNVEDLAEDARENVGELTNIISGHARATLSTTGLLLQSSTPSVTFGEKHEVQHEFSGSVVAIPFQTEYGDLTLEFAFEE